jgi:urease accessory protein
MASLRAIRIAAADSSMCVPFDLAVLTADERHIRRKVITLVHGDEVLFDLPLAQRLPDRARVFVEDGRNFEVIAAEEELLEVTARSQQHLTQLAWHIGNRHLEAQIEAQRILIRRDHVIANMLLGLGASTTEIHEAFFPEHGAYAHGH